MSESIGNKIIRLIEVGSTNTYIKDHSNLLKQHGLAVIAQMQTSGRGRTGKKFVSIPQKNLTFSVVLHPNLPIGEVQIFSLLAGVVVARVLDKYIRGVRLKWPNDVLVNEKKICGILIETITTPENIFPVLIMGIGLNTKGYQKEYPRELRKIITTIEEEILINRNSIHKGKEPIQIENETIFNKILNELDFCIKKFIEKKRKIYSFDCVSKARNNLLDEWMKRSQSKGRKVRCLNNLEDQKNSSVIVGTIEGLSAEGYLQIKTDSGEIMTHVCGDIIEIREDR